VKRVRDIFDKKTRKGIVEALTRRRHYYTFKFRNLPKRKEVIERYMKSTKCTRLHLGSGGYLLEDWLNSDIFCMADGMIFIDVRERLPFESDSLDFIYSEHLLEHLDYHDGLNLLKECFRILKKGGVVRSSTPDLSFLVEFYCNDSGDNRQYLKWASDFYWRLPIYSKAIVVNKYFRSWGHQFIYDYELLRIMCREIGFSDVTREGVGSSSYPQLRGIENHGNAISDRWNLKESLVLEAKK
jgi:predicted SAM-dependent methyltransferase